MDNFDGEKKFSLMSFIKKFSFKNIKFKGILVVVLLVIIAVIFISTFKTKDDNKEQVLEVKTNYCSAEEYSVRLENRLCSVLQNIKGIGSVEVFVMVESSPVIKYLEESTITNNKNGEGESETIQTTIVMSKDGSLSMPVVSVEMLPKVTGVLVVASGANDVKLKTTLINVVSSILSINVSNVEVLEGKT